jgi:DNA polymerase type B, organellar and viral
MEGRRVTRKSRARKLATIDCETDPFLYGRVPIPFLWDVFDGERHYTFRHTSDVVHFLEDKHWIVYAHNGGKFDYLMPGFLKGLAAGDKIMVINGRLAKFHMGLCEFRDSVNILPIALRDYQKEDIDYCKLERAVRERYMGEIEHYCRKDTEYLYEIVNGFRETYGDGLTLAGSAMKFWQEFCNVDAPRSDQSYYNRIAPFYYGGRCECFHVGEINEPFSLADINSAYPYAMMAEHPISTIDDWCKPKKSAEVIPQSLYQIHADSKGALPLRGRDGSLTFPHGKNVYFVTGWELLAGLETGTVKLFDVLARVDFTDTINFKKYINHFYEIKQESEKNSQSYIFSKLMMNSLYGKLAADPSDYSNYTLLEPDEVLPSGLDHCGDLGDLSVVASDLEEYQMHYFNVATGASITGFVRSFLWRHICKVREGGGRVLYCDTDSIAYTGPDSAFKISKELGEWGIDGRFQRGGIGGKKLYAFQREKGTFEKASKEWKKSCKGVDLSPSEIMRVCKGEEVTFNRPAPSLSYSRTITGVDEIDRKRLFVSRKTKLTGKTV